MSKYRINYSTKAVSDLNEIWEYIFQESLHENVSLDNVDSILNDIDLLVDHPEIGADLNNIAPFDSSYKFLVSGNYLVFYLIDQEEVHIVRILHCKRDFLRVLCE